MRLLYDLRLLDGHMHGQARYALCLLEAMLEQDPELTVLALLNRERDAVQVPLHDRVQTTACGLGPYGLAGQYKLPRTLAGREVDLYHCPFYSPLRRWPGPTVVSVHDLIHLRFPADYSFKHRLFYHWSLRPTLQRASAVITGSVHSKHDLVQLLGIKPAAITVTPYGVEPRFSPLTPLDREIAVKRLGLPAEYILAVGNAKPHKNLAALVRAHRRLRDNPPPEVDMVPPLVILGVRPEDLGAKPSDQGLVLLKDVDDDDLPDLFAAASLAAFPSRYEGFGLPALEAMAAGTPLLCSNRTSLPEVVGEAALLVDPDEDALRRGLIRLLADHDLRRALAQAGPARAAVFTWAATARATLEVYRRVTGGGRP